MQYEQDDNGSEINGLTWWGVAECVGMIAIGAMLAAMVIFSPLFSA